VVNGPSIAGLGAGGEGVPSFSIAGPTGEGVTTPLTFCRQRRSTIVDGMRFM
jgi:aldehyde dehydrogenase